MKNDAEVVSAWKVLKDSHIFGSPANTHLVGKEATLHRDDPDLLESLSNGGMEGGVDS